MLINVSVKVCVFVNFGEFHYEVACKTHVKNILAVFGHAAPVT